MICRLFLILIAATQIAALPVAIAPETAHIGQPLTLIITLPEEETNLVGLPDLGTFALLEPAIRNGNLLTLRLLPLRPGDQTIPGLPFQTGQRLESTTAISIAVEAPATPESPHPLRPFPEKTGQDRSTQKIALLVVGFALLMLLMAAALWARRLRTIKPADDPVDPFSHLAAAAQQARVRSDPDWDCFCQRLDRIRFAPLPRSDEELAELTVEFSRLKGERE